LQITFLTGAQLIEQSTAANAPKRRRWFRFSLKSLLIVMTVLAVWLGLYAKSIRDRREAIAAIERLGGSFTLKDDPDERWLSQFLGDEKYSYNPVGVRFIASIHRLSDDELKSVMPSLNHFPNLRFIWFTDALITDDALDLLLPLSDKLDALDLRGTSVSDAGIVHLNYLTKLRVLLFHTGSITPDGFAELQAASPDCKITFEK
jgi:hypothetical protein